MCVVETIKSFSAHFQNKSYYCSPRTVSALRLKGAPEPTLRITSGWYGVDARKNKLKKREVGPKRKVGRGGGGEKLPASSRSFLSTCGRD